MPQENTSEHVPKTPPPKSIAISSSPSTPVGSHATPVAAAASSVFPGPSPVRGIMDNTTSSVPSSPINNPVKDEEVGGFPVRKSSPALTEAALRNNLGRGSLTSQPSITIPISSSSSSSISTNGVSPEMGKRSMLGNDERVHTPVSSLSNRMMLPQGAKTSDVGGDNGNGGESGGMAARVFSPSGVPGIQWRPGTSFQNQHDGVCYFVLPLSA